MIGWYVGPGLRIDGLSGPVHIYGTRALFRSRVHNAHARHPGVHSSATWSFDKHHARWSWRDGTDGALRHDYSLTLRSHDKPWGDSRAGQNATWRGKEDPAR